MDLLRLSIATTSSIKVPCNPGLRYLPFQLAGIEYASLLRNVLFGDEMGLGKTIQSIGALNLTYKKTGKKSALIVTPASLRYNWLEELTKWHVAKPKITLYPDITGDIVLISYNMVSMRKHAAKIFNNFDYHTFVADEVHYIKNPKSLRSGNVLGKGALQSKAKRVHLISGTPMVNRALELYPIIKTFAPDAIDYMNNYQYGFKYCGGFMRDQGNGTQVADFKGGSNLKELGKRLRKCFMVRRYKSQVLPQLPEKYPPSIVRIGESGVQAPVELTEDALLRAKVADGHIATVRKELGKEKIAPACEYIINLLQSGLDKVVIFAHHKEVVAGLEQGLKNFSPVVISGSTSEKDRDKNKRAFQNDLSTRVFIGSITSAGVGLTLTAGAYCIFVEASYVPGENDQAIDRLHRIGQDRTVMVDFLVMANSLDERVLRKVLQKAKLINEAMYFEDPYKDFKP